MGQDFEIKSELFRFKQSYKVGSLWGFDIVRMSTFLAKIKEVVEINFA